jgi:CRP/FNR family transcriptional regulator, cyclic AMP receptor protein
MNVIVLPAFDPESFLERSRIGRRTVELKAKQSFFSQGDVADSIYYLRKGRAKVTVVSNEGKEATITLLAPRDFVGEESLASVGGKRLTTATADTLFLRQRFREAAQAASSYDIG